MKPKPNPRVLHGQTDDVRMPAKPKPVSTVTYRLLKDLPGVKSGAVLEGFNFFLFRGRHGSPAKKQYHFNRAQISRNKKWFKKIID